MTLKTTRVEHRYHGLLELGTMLSYWCCFHLTPSTMIPEIIKVERRYHGLLGMGTLP
jgi:hypothetical protein